MLLWKHEIPEFLNAIFLPIPRTALMLGCEYGCKDAVEVLLKNGADVSLVDGLGHDCAYYARIGDNIDILALIKAAVEDSSKGMDVAATACCYSFIWVAVLSVLSLNVSFSGQLQSFKQKADNQPAWEGGEERGFVFLFICL